MVEIYRNISNDVKEIAENAWKLAMDFEDAPAMAQFLVDTLQFYKYLLTAEEIEFLQFYFKLQMEMMSK